MIKRSAANVRARGIARGGVVIDTADVAARARGTGGASDAGVVWAWIGARRAAAAVGGSGTGIA